MSREIFRPEEIPLGYKSSELPSIYETYLCSEPCDVPLLLHNGPDDYTALLRTLQRSAEHFMEKDQLRAVERIQFEMAKLHMQNQQWDRSMRVLVPLWQTLSWRRAGWWNMLEEIDWALKECTIRVRDSEILLAVQWELINRSLTARQGSQTNCSNLLESLEPLGHKSRSVIRAESILSPISATFAFASGEGNAGEPLKSQIVLSSHAQSNSTPITISRIKVAFDGGLKDIHISHKSNVSNSDAQVTLLASLSLKKSTLDRGQDASNSLTSANLHGFADLGMPAGVVKVLNFTNVPRDAGDVEVSCLSLSMEEQDFEVELLITEEEQLNQKFMYASSAEQTRMKVTSGRSSAARILPKPPKLRIEPLNSVEEHYTDEMLFMDLDVINDEEDTADITLDIQLHGALEIMRTLEWVSKVELGDSYANESQSRGKLISGCIGTISPMGTQRHRICIHAAPEAAEYTLDIRARYFLLTDPETLIEKVTTTNVKFRRPFEASHDFSPVAHSAPWPKCFSTDGHDADARGSEENAANGLFQRWSLVSRITSLASVNLAVESVEVKVVGIHEEAACDISTINLPSDGKIIYPNDLKERSFNLDVQKTDLEDRRTTLVNLRLDIKWYREGSSGPSMNTSLDIPELVIAFGEPRVLACVHNAAGPPGPICLDYVLENPSIYTLTFNVTMDTSDEFAFSGPKNVTILLLPSSRRTVNYIVLPLVSGRWISPQIKVVDNYFNKTLKVNGSEGIRNDKRGISLWIDTKG